MTLTERIKVKRTLWILALRNGCGMKRIRREIQTCIDDAWDRAHTPGNLRAQMKWQQMFPGGMKPTTEEFIVVLARKMTAGEDVPYLLG